MDVRMPDGTVIKNVPDDITQTELLRRYELLQASQSTVTPKPEKEDGFLDMAKRAIVRGSKQTASLLGDVLPAMAARAVGADEYAERQMAEAAETQKEIQEKYAPRYGQLSDVKGVGDYVPFAVETILEQVPNLATSIVPGVGGAVLGGRLAVQQAAKTIAAKEAAKEVSEAAAKRYAAQAAATGVGRGTVGGAFLGSYALNAPEVFQNIYEETGQMEVGAAALAGSVSAALDSILPTALVKQFTPGMKMGVVEKILERSGMAPGVARGAAAGVITGVATEGPTEAAQEAISIAAEKFVQENAPIWGSKEFNRLIEAGVRGAVGGGGISGVAGGVKGFMERPREAKPVQEVDTGGTALDQVDQNEVEEEGFIELKAPEKLFSDDQLKDIIDFGTTIETDAKTPAAQPTITPELKTLQKQIAEIKGEIRRLEQTGTDEIIMEGWYKDLSDLESQERAMRRGEAAPTDLTSTEATPSGILRAPGARDEAMRMIGKTEEDLQAKREQVGERGKKYGLSEYERAITPDLLVDAGLNRSMAESIADQLQGNKVVGPTRGILNNVLQGKVKFGTEWRVPTERDIADANEVTKARYQRVADFAQNAPQQRLLPAQQLGLDLAPAEGEVSRDFVSPIAMSEEEFQLTAPEGQVAPETEITTETAGAAAAPLNLVDKTTNRLDTMLSYLQPSVQAEQGVKNYQAAIKNFNDEVKAYLDDADPDIREENLGVINEFFNRFGLTDSKQLASGLVADLKGKTPEQQTQLLGERTRLPNLTTPTGINQLRDMFQDFMEQQNIAAVGEFPGLAATKTFATDVYVPARVANILRQLRGRSEKSLTQEERAFMAYMSKFKYGLAMRSAAYDLANNIPMGDMFSNQGGRSAELFQKFVEENFPEQIYSAFTKTVSEYKVLAQRAARAANNMAAQDRLNKAIAQQIADETAEAATIRKTFFNANAPASLFTPMHPAIEQKLANGDLDGALKLIEQFPGARYWKLLAKRMRELNLNTVPRFDDQERLIRFDLARMAPSVDAFIENVKVAYPNVYEKQLAPAINEAGEIDTRALDKALKAIKKDNLLGENFTAGIQFQDISKAYDNAVAALDAPGFYMIGSDVINLNSKRGGNSFYAFFHELTHAATADAIRNPEKLDATQKEALGNLNKLYEYTLANYPQVYEYGFQNLDEFIAEAFTNTEFQNILSKLKYENTESSLWSKFITYVRRLLGGKDTVLFGTLANADVLMSAAQTRPANANDYSGTLMANAPPVKRTTAGTYKTAPDIELNRRWLDVLKGRPTWQQSKTGVSRLLENITDTTRKHYLGAFTLRQLEDLIGTRLGNSAKNFIQSIEGMLEEHNKIINESKGVLDKWTRYQSKNPAANDKLSLLMIDTTLAGIDPDKSQGKDAELDRRWAELDETGKEIYREVRDFYKRRIESYKQTLLRNIELSLIASNTPAAEIQNKLRQVEREFAKDSIEPYFPLKRFGQYWLQIGKGKDKEFYMFDSAGARNAAKDKLVLKGEKRPVFEGNSLRDVRLRNLQDIEMLSTIEKIVDEAAKDDPIMNSPYTSAKHGADTLREAIKDGLEELYILTLPSKSIRKNFLSRKGVSGASKDMLRAFADNSNHMAYQHARFKYSRQMFQQLEGADATLKLNAEEGKPDTKVDLDYLNELKQRLEYVMNPTDTGTLPTMLSNVSFMWYLTAPASALVNMLGVPAIGFPVLAARFGKTKAAATLLSYGKRFMTAGFKDKNGNWSMPSLDMTKLKPEEKAAYQVFTASGLIDITQAHDIAGLAESAANSYNGRMSTVMRGMSFMFHHAERFNREVMAMSAFRMAYDAAKKDGLSSKAAFDKAVDQAKDLTYRSMFDYSTLNKPRYLQNAYAKVLLQFKQFPQQMTYLLVNSGMQWFSKDNPALREEVRESLRLEYSRYNQTFPSNEKEQARLIDEEITRIQKEGRDRLLGTLGMTFLFAGATGLPLFSVGASVIEAVYAAFADDDEPPLDFENWFKNWLATTFGNFWGDAVSRGVVTQATGMNFADRMSLNDLWFRDARKAQDEVTAFQNMVFNLLGPTAGLGISAAESLKLFNDGMYYRAAEKIMPAVFRQPMVAARYSTEGVLTLKGDQLIEDISAKDALAQSLGFAPEKVSQKQKANIEKKTAEQEILSKRQDLLNALFMAIDTDDEDFQDRVLDKIDRFNDMYSDFPIRQQTLERSIKNRYKARGLAEITGGISINKNLIDTLDDMGFYGEEE